MKLEVVTHCWRYPRLLSYQLSSLVLHAPQHLAVTMTVFFTEEDEDTRRVLDYFARHAVPHVTWNWWPLPRTHLLRRGIGRNLAALATSADWVWFADADMVFRPGSLDALPGAITALPDHDTVRLVYPRTVLISRDHAAGDALIARAKVLPQIVAIDPQQFVPQRYNRAIGGVQIAPGGLLRQIGYCPRHRRHQQPSERWQLNREDVAFRRILGTRGTPITLPNVFRIRHSQRGYRGVDVRL